MIDVIGHGTWYDKIALEILKREQKLGRSLNSIKIESGVAASGIPHIGSLAEVVRNYAVNLAICEQGYNSEFIVFSDNKDGLRKVPTGLPRSLEKYLGFPVTNIPDPLKCHKSYGDHMVSLLLESLDNFEIKYKFISADEIYKKGMLKEEILTILKNAKKIGKIVEEETGQEKYKEILPYFSICSKCGRIYTTQSYEIMPNENKVLYKCEGMEIRGKWLEGCGNRGESDFTKGEGKLAWKAGEFAARWCALDIRFEAYGKDISDSVRINDRISREILKYEPPLHVRYEMFLDKTGKKISKSVGNVLTPQIWLKYGSTKSILLLTLKRFVGTRNISIIDIPEYMNEFDELEDIYFGKKKISDEKEFVKLSGLFKYCHFLKPPSIPELHIPYNLLAYLVKVAPQNDRINFIVSKLKGYGYIKNNLSSNNLDKRINYVSNWIQDFQEIKEKNVDLGINEKEAIKQLIQIIESDKNSDEIQGEIFNIIRKNNLEPKNFFGKIYMMLLGSTSGPRLGPYIITMGKDNVLNALRRGIQ